MMLYVGIAATIVQWHDAQVVHILPHPWYVRLSRWLVRWYICFQIGGAIDNLEFWIERPLLQPVWRFVDLIGDTPFPFPPSSD